VKLREAKIIKAKYTAKIIELRQEREKCSAVNIAAGENPLEYIHSTPDKITEKINQFHTQLLILNEKFRNACNKERKIAQLDGKFSVSVLLDRVRYLREEIEYYKHYASRLPKQRNNYNNSDLISVITYDIDSYKNKLQVLENETLKISNIIDELDNTIEVDYEVPENLL
jgi:hypothetical protein